MFAVDHRREPGGGPERALPQVGDSRDGIEVQDSSIPERPGADHRSRPVHGVEVLDVETPLAAGRSGGLAAQRLGRTVGDRPQLMDDLHPVAEAIDDGVQRCRHVLGHQGGRSASHDHGRGRVGTYDGQTVDPRRVQRQQGSNCRVVSHRFISQQHEPLSGRPTDQRPMRRLVQFPFRSVVGLAHRTGALHEPQQASDRVVNRGLGNLAGRHGLHQALPVPTGRSGHLQIQAGRCRGSRGLCAEPVRHHDPVEAPLVAQHSGQKMVVLRGIRPVDPVVGRHHTPSPSLGDRHLEGKQRHLPQRAVVDLRRDGVPLELGIVGHEVLDRGGHPTALHAAYVARGDLPG